MESIDKFVKLPEKKITSERAELLKFWVDNVKDKNGKTYRPSFICSKMSVYSVKDLYYLMSEAKDYERRGGSVSKYFWSLFRVEKDNDFP